jgi:hypothetical protein
MKRSIGPVALLVVCIGLAFVAGTVGSTPVDPAKMPEPVANTFKTMFPNATIDKLDVEEEEGVMVYDFEFRAGGKEKEADIAGDGTMMESTLVVVAKDIPAAAMKTIKKTAGKATLGRLEWIASYYKPEGGKLVQLPKEQISYAAEMNKGDKWAEVFVDPAGKITEKPVWAPRPAVTSANTGGQTGK